MGEDLIFRSDEASKGGFQAIRRVTGTLASVKRVASKFTQTDDRVPKDQAEVVLDDAEILEMDVGEPEPELKEGRFTYWMNYALPGKEKAHQNTFYVRGFLKSAEALAKERGIPNGGLNDLMGTAITLERKEIVLFKRKVEGSDEKEEITQENLVFATDSDADAGVDITEHVRGLVVGLNEKAALRNLLMDSKAKRHPEYKDALNGGTLADMLGITVVDGVFQDTTSAEETAELGEV